MVSLQEWLGYGDEKKVSDVLATFLCKKNPEVELFLHDSAIEFEKNSSARTYLLIDERTNKIAGYFTVSIGFANISNSRYLTTDEREQLMVSKCPDYRIPCYLIGQLGRNDEYEHGYLSGTDMLERALSILGDAKDIVGGKFVIVECEDCLVKIYQSERFGFRLFNTPDKKNRYNQLYRIL